jgi:hypothetical protein
MEDVQIGVIADTHGVLEPEVESAFREARPAKILHAGDIGGPEIIRRLSAITDVIAVAGNCDPPPFAHHLPFSGRLVVGSCKILMFHDLGMDEAPAGQVEQILAAEEPRVVIFGHTHRAVIFEREGILFFNPGSAGIQSGEAVRSYGFLKIREGVPIASIHSVRD